MSTSLIIFKASTWTIIALVISFAGTSKTFSRYINRSNCGGKAITAKNIFQLPSCNTPFEGLYNVGDTVFAGQGWPGVAIGVEVLNKKVEIIQELLHVLGDEQKHKYSSFLEWIIIILIAFEIIINLKDHIN